MAHTKSGGSTKLGRESASKRLGVKLQDGQIVFPGQIIIRQRGSKYLAGLNVKVAGDDSIYSMKEGKVKFTNKKKIRFDGNTRYVAVVSVVAKAQ